MLITESLYDVRIKNANNLSDNEFEDILSYDPQLYMLGDVDESTLKNTPESYVRWLLGLAKKGNLLDKSAENVRNVLKTFDAAKKRRTLLPNNDINSYKSFDDVSNAIEGIKDRLSINQINKDAKKGQKSLKSSEKRPGLYLDGAVELLFNGSDWEVWTPHTYEGSKALRRGAVWCTGGDTDTHYKRYSSLGKLYVIMNKKDNDEKLQLWVSDSGDSYEFRDKENEEKSFRMLCHENPELLQFFETQVNVVRAYPNLDDEDEAFEEQERTDWNEEKDEEVMDDFGLYWDDWGLYMGVDGSDMFAKNDYLTSDMVYSFLNDGYVDYYESEGLNDLRKILIENRDFLNCFYDKGYFDVLIELFKKEVPNHEMIDEKMVDTLFGLKNSPAYDETLAKWLQNRWVKVTSDNPSGDYVDDVIECISHIALETPLYVSIKDMLWDKCDISDKRRPSKYTLEAMEKNYEIPLDTGYESIRDFYETMRNNDIRNYSDYIEHYDIHWPNKKVEREVENCDEFDFYDADYAEEDADKILDLFATISEFNEYYGSENK